jgi:hypothetical protein
MNWTGTQLRLKNSGGSNGDTRYSGMDFVTGADEVARIVSKMNVDSTAANTYGDLRFLTKTVDDSYLTERMIIDSSGNVGIGIEQPNANLHIYEDRDNINAEINLESSDSVNGYWGIYHDRSSDDLRFWNSGENRFIITSEGNINIGTTLAPDDDPTYNLYAYEELSGAKIAIESGINAHAGIHIGKLNIAGDEQLYATIGFDEVHDSLIINNTGSFSNSHIAITPTGDVGIGTYAPGAKLDVKGNIKTEKIYSNSNSGTIHYGLDNKVYEVITLPPDWNGATYLLTLKMWGSNVHLIKTYLVHTAPPNVNVGFTELLTNTYHLGEIELNTEDGRGHFALNMEDQDTGSGDGTNNQALWSMNKLRVTYYNNYEEPSYPTQNWAWSYTRINF